ncbi:MAG TPA: hypothetical protein VGM82_05360 [Gemmatimonadaceae bacterium]
MTVVILAAGSACDPDAPNPPDGSETHAVVTRDSLSTRRTELVSDLQKRVLFLLSTSPNAPTAGVFTGGDGDSTLSISISNDTNHIAPRLVLENPPLVAELRSVGYRAVSFRDETGRTVVVPLPDATPLEVPTAPTGQAGEIVRRQFADSVAMRLRSVAADARARGPEREILYLDGLRGSGEIALGYANAVAGGMLSLERVRALRFTRMIVAGPTSLWCWNLAEMSGPVACSNAEIRTFR